MKKLLSILLVLTCVFSLVGCARESTAPASADIDLSVMSGTAVYSEVSNIMTSPEDYIDRTIKMKGLFTIYKNVETEQIYYACVIPDATACCQQGIEFTPKKDMTYPDDFPPLDSEIEVTGVFTPYDEEGVTYYELSDSVLTVL